MLKSGKLKAAAVSLGLATGMIASSANVFAGTASTLLYAIDGGSVTVDGWIYTTAKIKLVASEAGELSWLEGNFALTEDNDNEGYLSFVSSEPASVIAGFVDTSNLAQGVISYKAGASAPTVAAGDVLWTATYDVIGTTPQDYYDLPITINKAVIGGVTESNSVANVSVSVAPEEPRQITVYDFIEGMDQEYELGSTETADFTIDADYSLFETGGSLYVDGRLVEKGKYRSESGSTKIYLDPSYVNSLSAGSHVLLARFDNGNGMAHTRFNLLANNTGGNTSGSGTSGSGASSSGTSGSGTSGNNVGVPNAGAFTMANGGVVAVSLMATSLALAGVFIAVGRLANKKK